LSKIELKNNFNFENKCNQSPDAVGGVDILQPMLENYDPAVDLEQHAALEENFLDKL